MTTPTVTRRQPGSARRPPGPVGFPAKTQDVEAAGRSLGEAGDLLARRRAAWALYESIPAPASRDEAWRRTDLSGLKAESLQLGAVDDVAVEPGLLQPLAGDVEPALMVLRPGRSTSLSGAESLQRAGVVFADWATATERHSGLLEKHLGAVVEPGEGKFAAMAASLARDGVLVYVPPGVHVETPLHSILWAPGAGRAYFSRVLVVVDRDAHVTFVHETASPTVGGGAGFHAGTVELSLADGAHLTFVELQNWGEHIWNVTHERARVGRQGHLDWIFGAVGSRLTKNFTSLDLDGEGSEGRMSGFYFADGVQHLDHDTQQNHRAPHTTSDLLFKGALIGHSRSVWQGMIYVAPGAQKTDGYQANRNLLLSPTARADSIPGLEILADDVRCTHGATVGQLEQEPVFYLMTRGLPRPEAERMVVDGFFAPVLERIPFEQTRERFRQMIDDKMKALPTAAAHESR
jgi:Fe-S cluster assembly protein SufD